MEQKERTLYCGNLSDKMTEDLLYELFLQAGPLENVTIPKDKDGRQRNFGFVTFKHAVSVPYSVALMNGISLYGKQLRLDARTGAEAEPNPYLEQLRQYRNSYVQPGYYVNENRSFGYDQRESFEGSPRRYDSRFESREPEFHKRNTYQAFSPYSGFSAPYNAMQSPHASHGVSYPNRPNRNLKGWSGNRH